MASGGARKSRAIPRRRRGSWEAGAEPSCCWRLPRAWRSLSRRPYILESFLLGELPWLAAGFLVIGAALGGTAVVLMPTFCVWMNETGASAILSLQDIEKRRVEHGVLTSRFGRHLERLRRPSSMPLWLWQIHAMRAGNPDLLLSVAVRIVAHSGAGRRAAVRECGGRRR